MENKIGEIFKYILAGGVVIIILSQAICLLFGFLKNKSDAIEGIKEYLFWSLKVLFLVSIFAGWSWLCFSIEPWGMLIFGIPFIVIFYIYGRNSAKWKQKLEDDNKKDSDIEKQIQNLLQIYYKMDDATSVMGTDLEDLNLSVNEYISESLNNRLKDFKKIKERIKWQINELENSKVNPIFKRDHL